MKSKPFPWECGECGEVAVRPVRAPYYYAKVKHDNKLHSFTVLNLDIPTCASCGERVFCNSTEVVISAALRRHLGLLTPEQIRSGIAATRQTQSEFSDQTGIAAETISRWVTGTVIQSHAMDKYLRLVFATYIR
jgi:hypothetical protein